MGDSKRRKETLGDKYGQEENVLPFIPIKKGQAAQFVKWSTFGAWLGIGGLVTYWVTIRLLGPTFGWWQVN
ncbi:MAG: DUF2839 domain-containing protein [Cyanobacteria bacterium CAN_BIN43]|nr:DUF2839 domain-containing protein [Cyanobacteria bacterium CAN_BIN43]